MLAPVPPSASVTVIVFTSAAATPVATPLSATFAPLAATVTASVPE